MNKKTIFILIAVMVCIYLIGYLIIAVADSQSKAPLLLVDTPKDSTHQVGSVMNVLLFKQNHIYYYNGTETGKGKSVSLEELGNILTTMKRSADSARFTIIIKPAKNVSYKNLSDVIHQMATHDILKFATADISDGEKECIKNIQ